MREKGRERVRERGGGEGWTKVEGRRRNQNGKVATLFFTHFPEDFDEKRMWGFFNRWGKVVDVYIPRKRNKEGRRFGFLRMEGVLDTTELARKIDQMYIGDMKLYVNVPRFEKDHSKVLSRLSNGGEGVIPRRENLRRYNYPNQHIAVGSAGGGGGSYKQMLLKGHEGCDTGGGLKVAHSNNADVRSDEELSLEGLIEGWMERSLIGKLKSVELLGAAYDCFVMTGLHSVRVRYLGGLSVLLTGEEGVNLMEIIKDSGDEWKDIFTDVTPWSPDTSPEFRIPWLRCEDLPIQFWNHESFEKIVASVGTLVSIDEETSSFSRLNYARLRVKTSSQDPVIVNTKIRLNEKIITVRLVEELGQCDAKIHVPRAALSESDDDVSSWSQLVEKVENSVMGEAFGEEDESDVGVGESQGGNHGGEVQEEAPPQFNVVLGSKDREAIEEGEFIPINEAAVSNDKVGPLSKVEYTHTELSSDGNTHVSNSNPIGPLIEEVAQSHFKKNDIPIVDPYPVPDPEIQHSSVPSDNLQTETLRFGSLDDSQNDQEKDCVSTQVSCTNQTTHLNEDGLAVVSRQPPTVVDHLYEKSVEAVGGPKGNSLSLSCPDVRRQVRQQVFSAVSSLSDSGIYMGNKRFWLRNSEDEAKSIWDFGKLLGVTFSGKDKEMITRLVAMENRDCEERPAQSCREDGDDQSVAQ